MEGEGGEGRERGRDEGMRNREGGVVSCVVLVGITHESVSH